ncbi:YcaO-like family protein [Lichenihabitans psoromatis]|uniref:YcaO-like family protein n=1 Tax=Lichenihabitans psoromatis TaxID=2528642 RepID=UPI001FE0102C|nr:YcaO-like family protein [Lichenihabitans psoromatis]
MGTIQRIFRRTRPAHDAAPRRSLPWRYPVVTGLPEDLPDAARAYIEGLPQGRLVGFPMTGLDRTGVPAWKVALFLDDAGTLPGNMPSGYGYGTTDGDAIVGALAEIAEAICPTLRLMKTPWRRGSYRTLVAEVGRDRIVDPLTLCLPAGSLVDHDTSLAWTEAVRARNGERVLVPLDVAATDWFELPPDYTPFTSLITNGLGAGPDLDWAVGHGLLECLQRDGNGLLFRALDQGVVLDLGDDLDAETRELLAHIDRCGITVLPKFATEEFGLANVYVVGFDRPGSGPRVPIMLSACGEACDPDRNRALRKALLEFCSARVRKTYGHGPIAEALSVAPQGYVQAFVKRALPSLDHEESRALSEMIAWSKDDGSTLRRALDATVFSIRSHKRFGDLPAVALADTRERGAWARRQLEADGFDVLYIDGSPPGGGFAVAKVIVPGLEVETMSYSRIGERNARKLIARDSPLIRFGEESATLRPVRLSEAAFERLRPETSGRQPLFDVGEAERIVGPLYPLYREPEAHHVALRLGQLTHEVTP